MIIAEALEIGCGTGLLSLILAPYVKSLTAVDFSDGMIDVLEAKLNAQDEVKNVRPLCALIEDPDDKRLQDGDAPPRFDLICCHLTLHHIPQMEPFFKLLFNLLAPGGHIAVTDYEDYGPEAVRFHAKFKWHDVERHGIKKSEVDGIMKEAGFSNINVTQAFKLDKPVEEAQGGGRFEFPFLLMLGGKSS